MSTFLIINGIRTRGEKNVDLMIEPLEELGHQVIDLALPVIGPFTAASRTMQRRNGRLVRDQVVKHISRGEPIHAIAHSNGVATLYRAMQFPGVRFDCAFAFNGALREDYTWAYHGLKRGYNVHNPYDKALKWGKRARWLAPNHIFGVFGRTGYTQEPEDERWENVPNPFLDGDHNHNPFWTDVQVDRWALYMHRVVSDYESVAW